MSDDLLQTKLYMPRLRPSLVSRPRLIQILDQGLTGKLTLISAPAGFGKTTLIRCWIDALQAENAPTSPQIAWLSLDENDGAPGRFLSYVIAALQETISNHVLSLDDLNSCYEFKLFFPLWLWPERFVRNSSRKYWISWHTI